MSLSQKLQLIKSAKLTAEKNVFEFGKKIQKLNKELNIFLVLNEKAIEQAAARAGCRVRPHPVCSACARAH